MQLPVSLNSSLNLWEPALRLAAVWAIVAAAVAALAALEALLRWRQALRH